MGNCMSSNLNSKFNSNPNHGFYNATNLVEFERNQYIKKKRERSKMKHIDTILDL